MANACSEGIDVGFATLGYTEAAILGVVQGITELLPISSTAHMRIVPHFFGWQDPGSAFSAAMQLAALGAVITYFWRDISSLATSSVRALVHRQFDHPSFRFVFGIGLATLPIGVVGMTTSQMTINRDEIFGPIAAIIPARDYDKALAIANDTEARLSSAIVTKSSKVIRHFRDNAESDMIQVKLPKEGMDFHAPFTGLKQAGYGPAEKGSYARDFFTVFKVTHERFM